MVTRKGLKGKTRVCLAFIGGIMLGLLALTGVANALVADPFHFGLGAAATWMRDAGEPKAGDGVQYGLYLQKEVPTTTFAAAGASLSLPSALNGSNLNELSFTISGFPGTVGEPFGTSNGYCGAGAPRFNVVSTAGTCFLGCTHGDKAHNTSGWWTISFTPPFTEYAGCESGISGPIQSIEIIFDEGTDVGPGNVVLDNIEIKKANTTFVITGP
jgi:hypothetical protein